MGQSEGYVTHDELALMLSTHDTRVSEAFAMVAGLETRLGKNVKWLIGIIITLALAYASASAVSTASTEGRQSDLDNQQNAQLIETLKAVKEAATMIQVSSKNTSGRLNSMSREIEKVEARVTERIKELEHEQREHNKADSGR